MIFYLSINSIGSKGFTKEEYPLVNPFEKVLFFQKIESNFCIYELNKIIKNFLPNKYFLFIKSLSNNDCQFINKYGWCPLYWNLNFEDDKFNYGINLFSYDTLKELNNDNFNKLLSYLRQLKIDYLLN